MPELPEVETIRMGLEKKIVGLNVLETEVLSPKSFFGRISDLVNKKIISVWRRGKVLGIALEKDLTIMIHLPTKSPLTMTLLTGLLHKFHNQWSLADIRSRI